MNVMIVLGAVTMALAIWSLWLGFASIRKHSHLVEGTNLLSATSDQWRVIDDAKLTAAISLPMGVVGLLVGCATLMAAA